LTVSVIWCRTGSHVGDSRKWPIRNTVHSDYTILQAPGDRMAAARSALISALYERGSVILAPSKTFAERGWVLGDVVVAAAILDRLLHHSHVIGIRGESCRRREKKRAGPMIDVQWIDLRTPLTRAQRLGLSVAEAMEWENRQLCAEA
jgi:hypothetical protein